MLRTYMSSNLAISIVQTPGTFMINQMHEVLLVGFAGRVGGKNCTTE